MVIKKGSLIVNLNFTLVTHKRHEGCVSLPIGVMKAGVIKAAF